MSILSGYLQPSPTNETRKVYVSPRFKDEDGNVLPFVIRKINQEMANSLLKKCEITKKVQGQVITQTDNAKYSNELILACLVEPNLKEKEVCDFYGVLNPADVPGRMFSIGEYSALADAIMEFNDLDTAETIEEEAKN
jgi:hypothetical protein